MPFTTCAWCLDNVFLEFEPDADHLYVCGTCQENSHPSNKQILQLLLHLIHQVDELNEKITHRTAIQCKSCGEIFEGRINPHRHFQTTVTGRKRTVYTCNQKFIEVDLKSKAY